MLAVSLNEQDSPPALYEQLLGPSWQQLAEPVRLAHAKGSSVRGRGRLRIEQGHHPFARALAWLLRLPHASDAAETRLLITPHGDREQWLRTFADRRLESWQYHAGECELAERISLLEFRFRLEVSDGSLLFCQLGVVCLFRSIRVPIPAMLAPTVHAREDPAGAHRTHIAVSVTLPWAGPLLTYDGTIEIDGMRA